MPTISHMIASGDSYAQLYVVTVISNPQRYRARYALYKTFAQRVRDAGARLLTVEHSFGERPYEISESDDPWHVRVQTGHEIWLKENLLNIGISRLPLEAKYIATVDADFTFVREDWVSETIQQLQHHPVVQMFSEVGYLGPDSQVLRYRPGFAARWTRGELFQLQNSRTSNDLVFGAASRLGSLAEREDVPLPYTIKAPAHRHHDCPPCPPDPCPYPYPYPYGLSRSGKEWGAPGGAWAYRREALDQVGGLADFCILGSADWYMAAGAVGFMERAIPRAYSEGFRSRLLQWQERAKAWRKNIGFVPGVAMHHWHGKMKERGYGTREEVIRRYQFDPNTDLKHGSQGVLLLHDDGTERLRMLRDDCRLYLKSRNEDSIDLD